MRRNNPVSQRHRQVRNTRQRTKFGVTTSLPRTTRLLHHKNIRKVRHHNTRPLNRSLHTRPTRSRKQRASRRRLNRMLNSRKKLTSTGKRRCTRLLASIIRPRRRRRARRRRNQSNRTSRNTTRRKTRTTNNVRRTQQVLIITHSLVIIPVRQRFLHNIRNLLRIGTLKRRRNNILMCLLTILMLMRVTYNVRVNMSNINNRFHSTKCLSNTITLRCTRSNNLSNHHQV